MDRPEQHPCTTTGLAPQRARLSRGARARCGFSLVELVTVIAIIGVLAAVAVPRFFADRPFAERGYADELASALRNAQKVAVASGCWVSVSISATEYRAQQRDNAADCNNLGTWSTAVTRIDGTLLAGQPPAGVTVSGTTQFIFNGAGTLASAAGTVQVGPYTVTVVAATGLVTVN